MVRKKKSNRKKNHQKYESDNISIINNIEMVLDPSTQFPPCVHARISTDDYLFSFRGTTAIAAAAEAASAARHLSSQVIYKTE